MGVLVSLAAAWVPTRRVATLSPQAALQPDRGVDAGTPAGRWRIAAGLGLVGAGAALLALAVAVAVVPVMVVGGAASFTGLLLLGPVVMPALVRFGGRRAPSGARDGRAAGGGQRRPQPAADGGDHGVTAGRGHPDHGGADRAGQLARWPSTPRWTVRTRSTRP